MIRFQLAMVISSMNVLSDFQKTSSAKGAVTISIEAFPRFRGEASAHATDPVDSLHLDL
jgi:hypothetical protein